MEVYKGVLTSCVGICMFMLKVAADLYAKVMHPGSLSEGEQDMLSAHTLAGHAEHLACHSLMQHDQAVAGS